MSFPLHLVTPDRALTMQVTSVIIPGVDGVMGILAHHAPLICQLTEGGTVHIKGETDCLISVRGGIAHVRDNVLEIFTPFAEDACS